MVLWLPHRQDLKDLPATSQLVRKGLTVVSDRPGHRGFFPALRTGPVVAFRHSMDRLAAIEPISYPLVLVGAYVEEIDDRFTCLGNSYHQPWIDAFNPFHLGGPAITRHEPLVDEPVLRAALDTFTSTTRHGETMYRSDDGGRVTHGLMVLNDAGYRLGPAVLFAAALQRGWKGAGAMELRDVAAEIRGGTRKRPKAHYRSDILDVWANAEARVLP